MEVVRAFLALEVAEDVKERIMELERKIKASGADVKLVEQENLHITMKFLGDVTADVVERVYEAMKTVREVKFQLEVKGTGVFPNLRMIRVLWVGAGAGGDKVVSIFRQLDSELVRKGFPRERDFTPHITIGRVRSLRNKEDLLRVIEEYRGRIFGTIAIDKISLKKSELTPNGPIYSNLREVELGV
jgi:2'-5' RNA ligase